MLKNIIVTLDDVEKGYLVSDYENNPEISDDVFDVSTQWGREWYIAHFPKFNRSKSDE